MPRPDQATREAGRAKAAEIKARRDQAHTETDNARDYADALMWHEIGELIRTDQILQLDAAEATGYSRDHVSKQTARHIERPVPPQSATLHNDQEKTMTSTGTEAVLITSFGYLHGEAPGADVTVDLRRHFKDPHVTPELRYLTAHDQQVREAVRSTPGIPQLVAATAAAVLAYQAGPSAGGYPVHVASGCAGGRHRAASFALDLQAALAVLGIEARVEHRDLAKPVVHR
ncbi:RapZ C-terminal domain-containing protein [Kitasatospora purpeofusca]|uniref:RapZ C-terminal domain-containing protein n=1 Tax=Kitasatospora purpeofusca TaxID=67352 RepID=UPI0038243ECC